MTERKHKPQSNEEKSAPKSIDQSEQIKDLQTQLDSRHRKAGEYFEGWQRERADFVNYKKRVERDQVQTHQNVIGSITKKYLPVLDDLDRALKARPTNGEGANWAEGIELIYRKLQQILESDGVQGNQGSWRTF